MSKYKEIWKVCIVNGIPLESREVSKDQLDSISSRNEEYNPKSKYNIF